MNQGEAVRPTHEERQKYYDDEGELTEYIFWNYREYMTNLEQLTEKKMQVDESRRHDSLQGVVPFRNKVRDRILSEHGDQILINRCAKCNRIVATRRAQQCLWCGYDWHQTRRQINPESDGTGIRYIRLSGAGRSSQRSAAGKRLSVSQ